MKLNLFNKETQGLLGDTHRINIPASHEDLRPGLLAGLEEWIRAKCPTVESWYAWGVGTSYRSSSPIDALAIVIRFVEALGLRIPNTTSLPYPEAGSVGTFINGGDPPITHRIGQIEIKISIWTGFMEGGYRYSIQSPWGKYRFQM